MSVSLQSHSLVPPVMSRFSITVVTTEASESSSSNLLRPPQSRPHGRVGHSGPRHHAKRLNILSEREKP